MVLRYKNKIKTFLLLLSLKFEEGIIQALDLYDVPKN